MTVTRLTPRVAALTVLIADRHGRSSVEYRLCTQLSDALPRVIGVLRADTPDGYPTSTPGARDRDGGRSTSLDTLGNLVARRERTTATYSLLCAAVGSATACLALGDRTGVRNALNGALRVADGCQQRIDHAEYQRLKERLTCVRSLENDDGTDPWVDPLCERIADPGRQGMCEPCYRRRLRYMRAQAEAS